MTDTLEPVLHDTAPVVEAAPSPLPKKAAMGMWADLRRLRRQIAENQEAADAQIAPLQEQIDDVLAWLEEANEDLHAKAARIEQSLRLWLEARIAEDPRRGKTESLPKGGITLKKGSLTVDVADDDLLTSIAQQAWPEIVEQPDPPKPRVPKNALKRLIDDGVLKVQGNAEVPGTYQVVADTGEVLPGVTVTRKPETFTVQIQEM